MNNAVHNGRTVARKPRKPPCDPSGTVMLIGSAICAVFLIVSLTGRRSPNVSLETASITVMNELRENEAVSVFLGLDQLGDTAIPVIAAPDGDGDIYIDLSHGEWSLWSYFSDVIGKVFDPLLK